ncbi:methionyl-tRNA formyltransferase, mitochondrial isoform X2 [Anthonomus grandis grandis]|uniref:methionyl-tRNA formyltransferase, mitochondrial isoform X2 n=1 Tax=Anthonomus grandis grandis TaxID=2921223 RepID=UPI002164F931|nr:methionyl-tRNA formyltransferase, mitochondrial isoform X2 [Anthonomus grandis grandis]
MFFRGMLNVHASLLPRWRGASPIIYAIANGDLETGVTIMKINPNKFDTGNILWQEKCDIPPHIEMPELHEKLGKMGADCLVETIRHIHDRLENSVTQPQHGITYAPKITPKFARVNWSSSKAINVFNLHRALKSVMQPTTTWNSIPVKLYDIDIWDGDQRQSVQPGFVEYSRKNKVLIVECADKTWITIKRVGVQGMEPLPFKTVGGLTYDEVNTQIDTFYVDTLPSGSESEITMDSSDIEDETLVPTDMEGDLPVSEEEDPSDNIPLSELQQQWSKGKIPVWSNVHRPDPLP